MAGKTSCGVRWWSSVLSVHSWMCSRGWDSLFRILRSFLSDLLSNTSTKGVWAGLWRKGPGAHGTSVWPRWHCVFERTSNIDDTGWFNILSTQRKYNSASLNYRFIDLHKNTSASFCLEIKHLKKRPNIPADSCTVVTLCWNHFTSSSLL